MHILFLTHYFPPEVNAPASRTYEHAKRWKKEPGIKVTIVTNHPNHPKGVLFPGYKNRWLSTEEIDGIWVHRVKTFPAANAEVFKRLLNYLTFMVAAVIGSIQVPKPDVVIATSPQFFCAVAGYIVSRLKRAPFVFELRDIWPDSIVAVGAMKVSRTIRMLEKLELFLYRQAALIVAVTDSFRAYLVERGIAAEKITVVKNAVDLDFFQPRPVSSELVRRVGAEQKFVAAYIGTVGMAHAVEKIVEAAELLREHSDILFLIVGEGAHKEKVEALISSKGLSNIKALPGVNKKEIRDYYALTHLNLVTLRNTPLFLKVIPSKIFEIMAMARPVLSSVHGEARQILEAANAAEFVAPENPREMAAAVLRLRNDPQRLGELGQNGRQFVEKHYDRDRSAAALLAALKQLSPKIASSDAA
jgi:colanic acid biosynthesis glycosyl transferase WcaI